MKEGKNSAASPVVYIGCLLTILNVVFLVFWHFGDNYGVPATYGETTLGHEFSLPKVTEVETPLVEAVELVESPVISINIEEAVANGVCEDPLWCSIPLPEVSHFRFLPPPTDMNRWRIAQIQASTGEQVLLKEAIKQFPNPFDFLNGDRSFKPLQPLVDVFVNDRTWYNDITSKPAPLYEQQVTESIKDIIPAKELPKTRHNLIEDLGTLLKSVPGAWNFRKNNRAPVIQLGFPVFKKDDNTFFSGKTIGGVYLSQPRIFENWNLAKDHINTPFIALSVLNENWGFLSTVFPGRVANWSICRCEKIPRIGKLFRDFLDHDKTLMLMVSQHHNQSHPKILTLPRGLPLEWEATEKMVWDAQRYSLSHVRRETLLFASASSWGPRPRILRCISDRVPREYFEGHTENKKTYETKRTLETRSEYYYKLARSMFGLGLPGLGYDCFRTWELLTMGSIVVTERGVGYDRSFWKLPVLLVDDFSEINEKLLREAYLQALYYYKEFEFERLKQSYWFNIVANVSASKSSQILYDKFPMAAEDPTFTRPFVRYPCGTTNTCGPGTKRIPKEEC